MILILSSNAGERAQEDQQLLAHLATLQGIQTRVQVERGSEQALTQIYLIGNTKALDIEDMQSLPCVERVVRVSEEYRILGRHKDEQRPTHFDYNGVRFGQDTLHVFAGLCAVDNREHVEIMMKAVRDNGQVCTRMGAYKPRPNPYSFQGHGKNCLPYVFELAGKYGIRVIAMEITHEDHIDEIRSALRAAGNPTGVMLPIATRDLVDFPHVPVVKRLTRMPVCIDPSHSVGRRDRAPDGILDIFHVTAQGLIAAANMVLVGFHPAPAKALCDGPQALLLEELGTFLEDAAIVRQAYERRQGPAMAQ